MVFSFTITWLTSFPAGQTHSQDWNSHDPVLTRFKTIVQIWIFAFLDLLRWFFVLNCVKLKKKIIRMKSPVYPKKTRYIYVYLHLAIIAEKKNYIARYVFLQCRHLHLVHESPKKALYFLNNPFYDMFSAQLYLAVPNVRSNNTSFKCNFISPTICH